MQKNETAWLLVVQCPGLWAPLTSVTVAKQDIWLACSTTACLLCFQLRMGSNRSLFWNIMVAFPIPNCKSARQHAHNTDVSFVLSSGWPLLQAWWTSNSMFSEEKKALGLHSKKRDDLFRSRYSSSLTTSWHHCYVMLVWNRREITPTGSFHVNIYNVEKWLRRGLRCCNKVPKPRDVQYTLLFQLYKDTEMIQEGHISLFLTVQTHFRTPEISQFLILRFMIFQYCDNVATLKLICNVFIKNSIQKG